MEQAKAARGIFHGWWIVAAGFVSTALLIGSTTYSFGLFVAPLSAEFGLSRANANIGFMALLLGFAVWAPLVAFLMQSLGWRHALMVQGVFVGLVIAVVGWLLMRDKPADLGLTPDGQPLPQAGQGPMAVGETWTLAKLLRTRNFWLLSCGAGILLGADQALLSSLIPYGTDAGLTLAQASLLVSTLTLSAILGKLAIGALADRYDKRLLFCAVAACNFAFLVILLLSPGYVTLLIACSIIGLAIGGTYPLWTTLAADCFGTASFGSVLGSMNLLMVPFSIFAVRYIGEVFDRSGSYDVALITFMVTAVVSTVLILALRLPPRT